MSAQDRLAELLGPRVASVVAEVAREVVAPDLAAEREAWVAALAEIEAKGEAEWLLLPDAAELLGITEKALRSRIDRGWIAASKSAGRVYVSRTDIREAMEKKRRRRR